MSICGIEISDMKGGINWVFDWHGQWLSLEAKWWFRLLLAPSGCWFLQEQPSTSLIVWPHSDLRHTLLVRQEAQLQADKLSGLWCVFTFQTLVYMIGPPLKLLVFSRWVWSPYLSRDITHVVTYFMEPCITNQTYCTDVHTSGLSSAFCSLIRSKVLLLVNKNNNKGKGRVWDARFRFQKHLGARRESLLVSI